MGKTEFNTIELLITFEIVFDGRKEPNFRITQCNRGQCLPCTLHSFPSVLNFTQLICSLRLNTQNKPINIQNGEEYTVKELNRNGFALVYAGKNGS